MLVATAGQVRLHACCKLSPMRSSTPIRVVLTDQHRVLLRELRIVLADPAQFTAVGPPLREERTVIETRSQASRRLLASALGLG